MVQINKNQKQLRGPDKQAIATSADLLHLNPTRQHYSGLRLMISTAVEEWRGG